MKRQFALLCLSLIPVTVFAAFDLRDELDESTFRESGLEKLSDEELDNLNAAVAGLLGRQEEILIAETGSAQGDDRFGLETVKERVAEIFQADSPRTIESRILGEFKGWRGKTRFYLENGQVWQQAESDNFVVNVKDPKVTIRRGMFGSYLLKIEGFNSSVRVERIE